MKNELKSLKQARQKFWQMSWPAMISGLSVPILGLIDTSIVGRVDSPLALGAVALGSWLFDLLYWGFGFLRMGTTGLIAQARGRNAQQELRSLLARPLLLGLGFGILILIFAYYLAPTFLHYLAGQQAKSELIVKGIEYFRARIFGGPAVLMNYALLGWLLGMGDVKQALKMQVSLNSLNAVISLGLGLLYGVSGVGAASALAQWLVLIYWGIQIWFKDCPPLSSSVLIEQLKDLKAWRGLVALNLNLWLRTCLLLGSFGLLNALGARFGAMTLAANSLLFHLQSLQAFALDGFAHGAEIMVGEQLGAKNKKGYLVILRVGFEWTMITALIIALFYSVFGTLILELLTHHQVVISNAQDYLIWAVISPLLSAPCFLLDGVMIGAVASQTMRNGMLISALVLGGCLLLSLDQWGNHGLWFSFMLFMMTRCLTLLPKALSFAK
ncbi:MAG: MATE family efflux transporter [Myxococcales bacterium]|nr:MATE family efflux transporter [Myxococcales bacterium]